MSAPVLRSTSALLLLLFASLPSQALFAQVPIQAVASQQREAEYALDTEQNPIGATASGKRAAAFLYVENDHKTHVVICSPLFRDLLANHSHYANEINSQLLISAAAFLYGHPESAGNSPRQTLAGLLAALVVYEKFLAVDPATRAPALDRLVDLRNTGKLEASLTAACHPSQRN